MVAPYSPSKPPHDLAHTPLTALAQKASAPSLATPAMGSLLIIWARLDQLTHLVTTWATAKGIRTEGLHEPSLQCKHTN
eukprot:6189789-Pleurochrysis_carterae.AAC.2